MYFFHKFLSQFLGFNGFFRAFRGIFPSKMPHCTYFICPIYKIRIGVSSGMGLSGGKANPVVLQKLMDAALDA